LVRGRDMYLRIDR